MVKKKSKIQKAITKELSDRDDISVDAADAIYQDTLDTAMNDEEKLLEQALLEEGSISLLEGGDEAAPMAAPGSEGGMGDAIREFADELEREYGR